MKIKFQQPPIAVSIFLKSEKSGRFFCQKLKSAIFLNIFFLIVILGNSFGTFAAEKQPNRFEIRTETIRHLFSLDKGSPVSFEVLDSEKASHKWSGNVINHLNKSESSGAISIALKTENGDFKLLMSRKMLNGKLVYLVNMLMPGTSLAYKLVEEKDGNFILEKTNTENIVTP